MAGGNMNIKKFFKTKCLHFEISDFYEYLLYFDWVGRKVRGHLSCIVARAVQYCNKSYYTY